MKYYIIAGEKSGDLHGSNLVKALIGEDNKAVFQGIGGDKMRVAGVSITTHYKDLAVMGISEVIINFRRIFGVLNNCKRDIVEFVPDILILIDFGGFNLRIASFARSINLKTYYYISPKVWAWNQNRALKIKSRVDRMFVILPFEKEFYKKFDWEVDYVGNPVVDAVNGHIADPGFRTKNNIHPEKKIIALMPGSRKQELKMILPGIVPLATKFTEYQFIIAGVEELQEEYYARWINSSIKIVWNQTYDLLANSYAAIVASGTATLETALWNVPQVVVYRTSKFNYIIGSRLVDVPFISLVNLIAGDQVVKELVQRDFTIENLENEISVILDPSKREEILKGYSKIKEILGSNSTSKTTAKLMVKYSKEI